MSFLTGSMTLLGIRLAELLAEQYILVSSIAMKDTEVLNSFVSLNCSA